ELSEDVNVEKLAVKYGVRVCITAQALFTLLNNHGPSFQDAWEVPVCVRQVPARAGQQTDSLVFIESPLPPKEWTVRKRNEIFFQAALEAAMMNPTSNVALQAMTLEQPTSVPYLTFFTTLFKKLCNSIPRAVNASLDLTSDYTKMETFGNEMPIPCQQPSQDLSPVVGQLGETRSGFHGASVKGGGSSGATEEYRRPPLGVTAILAATGTSLLAAQSTNRGQAAASKSTLTLFGLDSEEASPRETELENLSSSGADETAETEPRPSESGAESSDTELVIDEGDNATSASRKRRLLSAGCPEQLACGEKGVDKEGSCAPFTSECLASSGQTTHLAPQGSCQEPGSDKAQSSPHTRVTKAAQKRRSASVDTGPLGHILKMQTKLMEAHVRRLPPPPPALYGTAVPAAPTAPPGIELGGSEQRPPTSPRAWPSGSSRDICLGRELFSKELLQEEEHASEFVPPATGNVAYKLFSLAELPLLVRTHVHRAQTRPRKASRTATKKQVPVRVFAKTEYQACYGLEVNTLAEDCALWLEATLNSNSWFYRGRVDVLTAEPLLLEEFSSSDLRRSLHYNPTEPLKLLHRIMKRLYSLPAGHYLLSHVAGDVSGALSSSVSSARSAYNLHSAHGQLPKAACSPCVPWVPINTCLLLPFHSQYGRVPGTFPPSPQGRGTANKVRG
uniref:Little elongation complex subunit 2 C-terminal domain-containing protein n=1 Tax=Petromyzon marinus TaxID=7757 RepID=S4RE75_PETMA